MTRTRNVSVSALLAVAAAAAVLPGVAAAREVSPDEARRAAAVLIAREAAGTAFRRVPTASLRLQRVVTLEAAGRAVAYVAETSPPGFLVMPASTDLAPVKLSVIGASWAELEDDPLVRAVLAELQEVRDAGGACGAIRPLRPRLGAAPASPVRAAAATQRQVNEGAWESLLGARVTAQSFRGTGSRAGIYPMTSTRWGQAAPFWQYTPDINGHDTYTGCVATATAQLMRWWEWPTEGTGSHSYTWDGAPCASGEPDPAPTTLSADFAHAYDWTLMPATKGAMDTAAEKDAVARLMSDVGIALEMQYGCSGSGAWTGMIASILPGYFGYDAASAHLLSYSSYGSAAAWFEALRTELDHNRPLILSIRGPAGGHAVVADGYRVDAGLDQIHLNMGWEGYCDAYYTVDGINCAIDLTYLSSQYAVVGLLPGTVRRFGATYGGPSADALEGAQLTADGGSVLVGHESSWGMGLADAWVMKLDAAGARSWAKTLGGGGDDVFHAVQQLGDGSYLAVGSQASWSVGGADGWIVKFDAAGNRTWSVNLGGSADDVFEDVQQTADGGFIAVGHEASWGAGGSDGWAVRFDAAGNRVWSAAFGGASDDAFHAVEQTADGGFIIAGEEASWGNGGADGWLVKLDASGARVWSANFGGGADDAFMDVHQASDGAFLVAGRESSWGMGASDGWIMKVTAAGVRSWAGSFGGASGDGFLAVRETADGNVLAVGSESSWGAGAADGWLVELTAGGALQWARTYGGVAGDELRDVLETPDRGLLAVGTEASWGLGNGDGWGVKLDRSGNR